MLQRIDTDAAVYVVILYDPTDYQENVKFNEGNGMLETMSKEMYDSVVALYLQQQRYYPGKYTNTLVPSLLFGQLPRNHRPQATSDDHATEFVEVLINGKVTSLNSQLVVIGRTEGFIAALRKNLLSNDYPRAIEDLIAVDVSDKLTRGEHYFVVDDHMRPLGHRLIANEILKVLVRHDR